MAQTEKQKQYDAQNTTRVFLKLSKLYDSDILDKLASTGNKQGYIKALIRRDIAETKKNG